MPPAGESCDKIKVAVRVRPLNRREIDMKTPVVVDMNDNQTYLYNNGVAFQKGDEKSAAVKSFGFDESFWSIDPSNEKFASQEFVFERLGIDVMANAFQGYNACIFAYGQTGSGKSYTMMGTSSQPGIIPRLCNSIFDEISSRERLNVSYKIEVSYMEIYNEKVHDLLDVQGMNPSQRKSLRVREHNILGPYVDGLSQLVVTCLSDIEKLMIEGNKSRTVASTNMNCESSRSHAVFNIILTETMADPMSDVVGEKKSKISLVDLAGSERAQKTGAVGERLREGCNINKSLTTLMLVISSLADAKSNTIKKSKSGNKTSGFVPYRDSVLTWLLKDNLGGNSKTVMVATLSPAADNYEETLSTLRYADRAKRIVNHAVVNEDPNAKIIRELREQVEELKKELVNAKERQAPNLKEKLEESENIIKQLSKTWEEKLIETEKKHKERHEALEKMGISVQMSGIKVERSKYYLVNLNADPSLNELLVYYLKDITEVGRGSTQDIQLHGLGIQEKHCLLEILENEVYLTPLDNARTLLNGKFLTGKTKINNKDRILWGMNHFFRLNCPKKMNIPENEVSLSREEFSQNEEFQKAQEEVMMAELHDDPIQQAISDLEKHHIAEKEEALTRQRLEYEKQLEALKEQMIIPSVTERDRSDELIRPLSPSVSNLMTMSQYSGSMMNLPPAYGSYAAAAAAMVSNQVNVSGLWPSSVPMPTWMGSQTNIFATPNNLQLVQAKYQSWVEQRQHSLAQVLVKLREQLSKANALTREANFLADEMAKSTEYSVTLQIPAASLNPNGKKGGIISEPAILVKRDNKSSQIWSLEKLENKVVEMRDLYEEWKDTCYPTRTPLENPFNQNENTSSGEYIIKDDPFFDAQEDHSLIGVANIYLSCLFHQIKFKYQVPIINQQGEISGKLAMELSVIKGELPELSTRESSAMSTSIYSQSQNQMSMTSSMISGPGYNCDNSDDTSGPSRSTSGYSLGSSVTVRVRIFQATYLPEHLSHFVFCQYHFWGEEDATVVPPALQPDYVQRNTDKTTFKFNHSTEFHVMLTDELLEHFAENALSIEVYGNRNPGFAVMQEYERSLGNLWNGNSKSDPSLKHADTAVSGATAAASMSTADKQNEARTICRKFGDRWIELYRRLEFWVCIEELNENGKYQKVDLKPSSNSYFSDLATGGQFQLKHGQTRRVRVFVRTNKLSRGCRGSLPLICDKVQEISIGDIFVVNKGSNKCPDSYQEEDLNRLRDAWSVAVCKRQEYLNEKLQKLVDIPNKKPLEQDRENSLMDQWMRLTEERNAVLVPAPGSGIPGAPATWSPVDGMEKHCPLIFLNIKNEEISTAGPAALSDPGLVPCGIDNHGNVMVMAGGNCMLNSSNSEESEFITLPIVKRYETLCGAVAQWDSSLHDSIFLNTVTQTGDRIYVTVRAVISLSHPNMVNLVLRKRICINIYRTQTFTNFLKKKWTRYINDDDSLRSVWNGVTYQIVSGIPQNSLDIEDRESLAQLAASQTEKSVSSGDQESYIEKYIRSVSAVESLLQVDRIRQEVACQEILAQLKKQRRSTYIQNDIQPDLSRRGPIIGNPSVIASSGVEYSHALMNNANSGLKKYISVPDFQGMYRSSSLTNIKGAIDSPVGSESKFSSKENDKMNYENAKSESISNLSKFSNEVITSNNSTNVSIKSPLIPKRPPPPKNLLNRPGLLKIRPYRWSMIVVSKNSLMSPLVSTNSNINQSVGNNHCQNNNNNNSRSDVKTMHTLKEELNSNLKLDKLSCSSNANEVDSMDIEFDENKMKLNRSVTEDSLTRSKSSGYGSSLTVSSLKPGVITSSNTSNNNNIVINNNNIESEIETATICGSPDMEHNQYSNSTSLKSKNTSINIGTRVYTLSNKGETLFATVKYLNSTQFDSGIWVGLELDDNKGNHNGTVNGIKYFTCAHNHGIFTRPDNVFIVN